jgi:hypothetical protein
MPLWSIESARPLHPRPRRHAARAEATRPLAGLVSGIHPFTSVEAVQVPEPDIVVIARRGQDAGVGREGDVAQHFGLGIQAPQFKPDRDAPEDHEAIAGAGRQEPPIGRECQQADRGGEAGDAPDLAA